MSSKPRAEMTPAERNRARRLNKESVWMRQQGRPKTCFQHEHDELRDRIRKFNERGMSITQMSEQTGLSLTFFSDRINGRAQGTKRWCYDIAMKMYFEPATRRDDCRVSGAKMPDTGTRRRLQALLRMGFSTVFLAPLMGCSQQRVNYLVNGYGRYVYGQTFTKVVELYDKYALVNPLDLGISSNSVKRAISAAIKNDYAPPGAWDDDTIDDPNAYPELTGYCGKLAGAFIHLRTDTRICDRCMHSVENKKNVVDVYKFYEIYKEGHSHTEAAQLLGISKDLYSQYAQYLRPEERKVHYLSSMDKTAATAYCDACRDRVPTYRKGESGYVCANGVRKYREGKGL